MPLVKSKSHKSSGAYRNVIDYVLREDAQYMDAEGRRLFLKHNVLGKREQIDTLVQHYLDNLQNRKVVRKDNIAVIHEILSFHPQNRDQLSVPILKDIARKYIQGRNPFGMFVITAHQDREHIHMHAVISPVEISTGKSLRMSKADFLLMQQQLNSFQQEKYPQLDMSLIEYGKVKKN